MGWGAESELARTRSLSGQNRSEEALFKSLRQRKEDLAAARSVASTPAPAGS